jgi:hypothetical protein
MALELMPEIFTAWSRVTRATGSEHSEQKALWSLREPLITSTSCCSRVVLVLRVLFIVCLVEPLGLKYNPHKIASHGLGLSQLAAFRRDIAVISGIGSRRGAAEPYEHGCNCSTVIRLACTVRKRTEPHFHQLKCRF